jgi:hypothetical protein
MGEPVALRAGVPRSPQGRVRRAVVPRVREQLCEHDREYEIARRVNVGATAGGRAQREKQECAEVSRGVRHTRRGCADSLTLLSPCTPGCAGSPRTSPVKPSDSSRGAHADAARHLVLAIVFAQLLADAGHDGPPHASLRAPRHARPKRHRLPHRDTLSGRRPRG